MNDVIYEKYAQIIISSLLRLEEGENLYINTESSNLYFVRQLAKMASEHTGKTVNVLLTSKGKPEEVIPFDPKLFFSGTESRTVMLHIQGNKNISEDNIIPDLKNLVHMQKYGHLGEPVVLDRQIAVPWCVIPCPNENSETFVDEWKFIKNKIYPEGTNLTKQSSLLSLRKNFLNHQENTKLKIIGDNTNIEIEFCDNTHYISGETILKDGRSFLTSLDFMKLSRTISKNKTNGYGRFKTKIFGHDCDIDIEFKNGIPTPKNTNQWISSYFGLETEHLLPGFITLCDNNSSITLGPGLVESLNFKDDLPNDFSQGIYSLELLFEKEIRVIDEDFVIIDKGIFFE